MGIFIPNDFMDKLCDKAKRSGYSLKIEINNSVVDESYVDLIITNFGLDNELNSSGYQRRHEEYTRLYQSQLSKSFNTEAYMTGVIENLICKMDEKIGRLTRGGKKKLSIEKVIFNDPATIVFWNNGTKTVVKAQNNEPFDPEKGLAIAISKKFLGNKSNFNNVFKKYLPKE